MYEKAENEFVELICGLSDAVCTRLEQFFPTNSIKDFRAGLSDIDNKRILADTIQAWHAHNVFYNGSVSNYEDLTSIFLIHFFGHVNRIGLQGVNDRPKFNYLYLAIIDKALTLDVPRERFIRCSERLYMKKAA